MLADEAFGDGFAFDSSMQSAAIVDCADISEGEDVRFFPGLQRRDDPHRDVTMRVLARAAQIEKRATAASASERKAARKKLGRRSDAQSARSAVWPAETSEDALWLRSLVNSRSVRPEIGDLRLMARFAFLTGIHPAYIWAEAEILPAWGATAAWLGQLSRRGRALMLPEVAEFLTDALVLTGGKTKLRDPSFSDLLIDEALTAMLLRVSRRCLAGAAVEVRWPSDGLTRVVSICVAVSRRVMLVALIFSQSHSRRPP
jgi:hypothetical protein